MKYLGFIPLGIAFIVYGIYLKNTTQGPQDIMNTTTLHGVFFNGIFFIGLGVVVPIITAIQDRRMARISKAFKEASDMRSQKLDNNTTL